MNLPLAEMRELFAKNYGSVALLYLSPVPDPEPTERKEAIDIPPT
jgi:hypothetical protein